MSDTARYRLLSASPDHEFPEGGFDVRGWVVAAETGAEPLGRVHDLVLDASGQARYVDVKLGAGDCVLVPIGQARVAEHEDVVLLDDVATERLRGAPRFRDDAAQLTREYEAAVCAALDETAASESSHASPGELISLNESRKYRVPASESDPRGWVLILAGGVFAGRVTDLLADPDARKVRYLVCALESGRNVLVPLVYARLDAESEQVVVDAITPAAADALPAHDALPLAREKERALHDAFTGGVGGGDAHRHPRYSAQRFFGARVRRGAAGHGRRRFSRDPDAPAPPPSGADPRTSRANS